VIPGTSRRNLWVSIAACVPVLISVYVFTPRPHTLPATFNMALWTAIIVATATLASGVIHGLQQRVRDAAEVGQYTLEEKIGEGGMGVVYRARHLFLRRPTAVKLLPPARAGAETLARFEREVQQTSRLTHPNTVAIYDYGHTADGVFYYAMEFLDGVSLEQLVQHDGPQPPGRVVRILRQVCGALAEAHEAGLIHRDVKPANLLLCVRGGIPDLVKVLDFGLVKEVGGDSPELSTAGAFVGTPLYSAPEGISRPDQVDARSDLYALGAVAYFLLTATPPFGGATLVEVCSKHLHAAPDSPSARLGRPLPPALEALVLRCLAKRPDDRPPSAAALAEALDDCPDVPPWTDAAARAWWADRGAAIKEALAQARRGQRPTGEGQRTVMVDLGERAS
jgi:serine/threonine-protein kinase